MSRLSLIFTFLCVFVVTTAEADTFLRNAQIHPLGTLIDLEDEMAALRQRIAGPAWVAYTVPMASGRQRLCCRGGSFVLSQDGAHGCPLERSRDMFLEGDPSGPPSTTLRVLLRIEDHRLSDIRSFSAACPLDAGGLPVYLWQGAEAQQSLDFLVAEAESGRGKLGERALLAIAQHAAPETDHILERIARRKLLPRLAEEAIFWLGEARGSRGFEVLARLRLDLQDTTRRQKLAFALHLNSDPGALPMLIEMARQDPDRGVRGQALLWLAQEASAKSVDVILEASETDPEVAVQEQAIFALSQLPRDRGVPLLIRYAKTHAQPEVRKKALFWLGQSDDPRALDFFEEILLR